MKLIRYIGKTSVTKLFNSKTGTFLFAFSIYAWSAVQPYLQFVRENEYPISWCIFPFCMTSYSILGLYYFGMVYVNSDVPFMQHENMYQIIRTGRRRWALGQIGGIFVRSFFLTMFSVLVTILPFAGHIEFTNDWGKVIHTLASFKRSSNFYMENNVDFTFSYDALKVFTPLELMGVTVLLCILILTFLGTLMFLIGLLSGKYWAVVGGFVLACLLFVVENIPEYGRLAVSHFVPVCWLEVALIATPNAGYYRLPSIPYMLTFLGISIVLLTVIICLRVKQIEFIWENEDA